MLWTTDALTLNLGNHLCVAGPDTGASSGTDIIFALEVFLGHSSTISVSILKVKILVYDAYLGGGFKEIGPNSTASALRAGG